MDLEKHKKVAKQLQQITPDQLKFNPEILNRFAETTTDFIMNYIDIQQLIDGTFAKSWNGFSLPEFSPEGDVFYNPVERNVIIREKVKAKVDEMLMLTSKDTSLSDYLRRFICDTTMDQCGGFELNDIRADQSTSSMHYLRQQKLTNIWNFVSTQLDGISGFILGIEHDHKSALPSSRKDIMFHQFNPDIHKDNGAKAIYYTSNLKVVEHTPEEIKEKLIEKEITKYIEQYEKFTDKFVVFTVSLFDPSKKSNSIFDDGPITFIGVHNKSCGSKKDIAKNKMEYCVIRSVVELFSDERFGILGDFNVPKFEEGVEHFKFTKDDCVDYPIENSGSNSNEDSVITRGLTCYSEYEPETVVIKYRSPNTKYNSQAFKLKFGPRQYNTDGFYGNIGNIESVECCLYPQISKPAKQIIPYVTGDPKTDWLTDHQAPIVKLNGNTKIVVYNTLSDSASKPRTYKSTLSQEELAKAEEEHLALLTALANFVTC